MTVEELIKKLERCPKDFIVDFCECHGCIMTSPKHYDKCVGDLVIAPDGTVFDEEGLMDEMDE
jgi:hypothetical protein